MFFLGDFLGDYFSIADTPTDISNSHSLSLENGLYDEMYVGQDNDLTESDEEIPEGFDNDTILHAGFNDTANAGNVDWSTNDIDHIVLQRRKEGTNNWVIIASRSVLDPETDFRFSGADTTAAANTRYEYAVVPYEDGVQGDFSSETIFSKFSGIYIVGRDRIYGTPITDGMINTTRNIQKSFNVALNRRYPIACSNSAGNYDTGDCVGNWMRFNPYTCQFEDSDEQRVPYQLEFMDWLTNGEPKILKSQDGRIWLIEINPSPTDTGSELYNMREVSFQWTEIGSTNNESDLFYAGFVDADEMWWRNG